MRLRVRLRAAVVRRRHRCRDTGLLRQAPSTGIPVAELQRERPGAEPADRGRHGVAVGDQRRRIERHVPAATTPGEWHLRRNASAARHQAQAGVTGRRRRAVHEQLHLDRHGRLAICHEGRCRARDRFEPDSRCHARGDVADRDAERPPRGVAAPSDAVQVTLVVPTANSDPLSGSQLTCGDGSTVSVAVGVPNVTARPSGSEVVTAMSEGTPLMAGAVVSTTVTSKWSVVVAPTESVTSRSRSSSRRPAIRCPARRARRCRIRVVFGVGRRYGPARGPATLGVSFGRERGGDGQGRRGVRHDAHTRSSRWSRCVRSRSRRCFPLGRPPGST